jgi:hypothetical protein
LEVAATIALVEDLRKVFEEHGCGAAATADHRPHRGTCLSEALGSAKAFGAYAIFDHQLMMKDPFCHELGSLPISRQITSV